MMHNAGLERQMKPVPPSRKEGLRVACVSMLVLGMIGCAPTPEPTSYSGKTSTARASEATLSIPLAEGRIEVFADGQIPQNVFLKEKRRKERLMGGDRTGILLARFLPHGQSEDAYAWINVVVSQKNTPPVTFKGKELHFPHMDPLPGKTEFGRADTLPYYWDYADINPRRKGVQGITGGNSDLIFPGEPQDGIDEFWDGPEDQARAEVSFVTFLVRRPLEDSEQVVLPVGGFRWTFHEGPHRKGFNNGDEKITDIGVVDIDEQALLLIRSALDHSAMNSWRVHPES